MRIRFLCSVLNWNRSTQCSEAERTRMRPKPSECALTPSSYVTWVPVAGGRTPQSQLSLQEVGVVAEARATRRGVCLAPCQVPSGRSIERRRRRPAAPRRRRRRHGAAVAAPAKVRWRAQGLAGGGGSRAPRAGRGHRRWPAAEPARRPRIAHSRRWLRLDAVPAHVVPPRSAPSELVVLVALSTSSSAAQTHPRVACRRSPLGHGRGGDPETLACRLEPRCRRR